MLQVSKKGEVEKDENRHHLATGHSEFAVPPFLWGTLFQGMTFDYGVVFFQEFIIRKTICPKSQNDLSEEWGDNTAFFRRLVFRRIAIP